MIVGGGKYNHLSGTGSPGFFGKWVIKRLLLYYGVCLSFFLSPMGQHTLHSHPSAEPYLTGWPNALPQGWDYCSVVQHHHAGRHFQGNV